MEIRVFGTKFALLDHVSLSPLVLDLASFVIMGFAVDEYICYDALNFLCVGARDVLRRINFR